MPSSIGHKVLLHRHSAGAPTPPEPGEIVALGRHNGHVVDLHYDIKVGDEVIPNVPILPPGNYPRDTGHFATYE